MLRWLLACMMAMAVPIAWAQRPPALQPVDASEVIERLPAGYAQLEPSRHSSGPQDSLEDVRRLLTTAARTGDARLAARADAMLARFPPTDSRAYLLRMRAFSAQHRHDFGAALRVLDSLLEREPRDGDARLARAQINLVQGHLASVRNDCVALTLGVDEGRGLLCVASLALRKGEFSNAKSIIDRWLDAAPKSDPSRRYVLVMRAEAAWRGGDGDADAWFRRALSLEPRDARSLLSYSRFLRSVDRNEEVEALLREAAGNDGLQLQRALAAHAVGGVQAMALARAQGRRYALAHQAGSQPELRDEAEYLLTLRGKPGAALVLAQRNFETQRDYEDVDILRRAAIAAGRPQALEALEDWAHSQGLTLMGMEP